MKKSRICLILAAVYLLCCCGCAASGGAQEGCLELVDSPATTLNNIWYNTGGIFRCAVFESLLTTDADMQTLRPALAERYARSDDGLTYEFTLRQDALWHDGHAVDGTDVLFSLQLLLRSREVNGLLSSAFGYIEGAEDYQKGLTQKLSGVSIRENTLTIRLVSPVSSFLDAIAQFAILPEHILRDADPEQLESHAYWEAPIGCGPYRITEAQSGSHYILERWDAYYGTRPGVAKIRLRTALEDCVGAMKDGTLDFYVTNDPAEIATLKGARSCSGHQLNILFPAYLIFNLSQDAGAREDLQDVRVRRALLMAIDRETIVEAVFPGSTVSDTLVPAWDSWYAGEETYPFDPDGARELLNEAGFDFSLPIRLRYFTKGQSTADLMGAIAVYWRAIGIQVDLAMFEGSGSKHMFEVRDFDVCYKRLSAFSHGAIYEEMSGDGVMQTSLYRQNVYDTLIGQLSATREEASRKAIVARLQAVDQEYLLRLPLFALANVAYVNDSRFEMPEAYGNLWYRYDLRFGDWRLKN